VKKEERQQPEHPLDRERKQLENRGGSRRKPLISRRALGLLILGILGASVLLTTQLFFPLLKEITKGRRRRKK
jgi:hypothetical protein